MDWLLYDAVIVVVLIAVGYYLGIRQADGYWAMHDGNGAVHHKGRFYLVGDEQTYRLVRKTEERLDAENIVRRLASG
jgi:hypothetical protein